MDRHPDCRGATPRGLELATSVLRGRWKPSILWLLLPKPKRFSDLSSNLSGVSAKVLSEQLRALERDALVRRRRIDGSSRLAVYELTEIGGRLAQVLPDLEAWGVRYRATVPTAERRHGLADFHSSSASPTSSS